jgi:hypothetical protein
MTEQKHNDIRDAINAGMISTDIRDLLSTSAASIIKVKRLMGLPIRKMRPPRTRGPVKAAAQVAAKASTMAQSLGNGG